MLARSDSTPAAIELEWTEEKQKLWKSFRFEPDKDKAVIKIGRKPNYQCDLCLEDPYVEWVHAEITFKREGEEGFYLRLKTLDNHSNENPDEEKLKAGSHIPLGKTVLRVVKIYTDKETPLDPHREKLWTRLLTFPRSSVLWQRFFASCIDFVISLIGAFFILLFLIWLSSIYDDFSNPYDNPALVVLQIMPFIVYPTFCEFKFIGKKENRKLNLDLTTIPFSSHVSSQASLGKRLLGIYVADLNNNPISIFHSIARCLSQPLFIFVYFLSILFPIQAFLSKRLGFTPIEDNTGFLCFCAITIIVLANFITLAFTKGKQSLRDWTTQTQLVAKEKSPPLYSLIQGAFKFLVKKWFFILLFSSVLFLTVFPFHENFFNRGEENFKLGENDYAQKEYKKAIDDYGKAIKDYEKAIAIKSDYSQASTERGKAYFERGKAHYEQKEYSEAIKDYGEASKDYGEAINIQSDYSEAYFERGKAHYEQKEYNEALNDYGEAINIQSGYSEAYFERGRARYEQKEYEQAFKDFGEFSRICGKQGTTSSCQDLQKRINQMSEDSKTVYKIPSYRIGVYLEFDMDGLAKRVALKLEQAGLLDKQGLWVTQTKDAVALKYDRDAEGVLEQAKKIALDTEGVASVTTQLNFQGS